MSDKPKSISFQYNKCLDTCTRVLMKKLREETNNQNLINLCFEDKIIRKHLGNFLESCITYSDKNQKNEKVAVKFLQQGDEALKKKLYEKCLLQFTESIFYAEIDKKTLPLAYSGRAKTLFKLCKMEASLHDIDMALKSGIPNYQIPVLMYIKAKILVLLERFEESKKILQELKLKLNSVLNKEAFQLFQNELQEDEELNTEFIKSRLICQNKAKLPEIAGGKNDSFDSASAHLEIFYDKIKGRYVRAMKDLQMGDVLFVEKPFAYIYFFRNICHECGIKVLNLIPCDFCTSVSYCSVKCKEKFWESTHSFECQFFSFFETIGIAHLSLRVVLAASKSFEELKMKLDKIVDFKPSTKQITIKSNNYSDVYNLESNIEKFNKADFIQYLLTAYLLALFLKKHTRYFLNAPGNEDLKLLVSVLSRHIAHLICNGSAISSTDFTAKEKFCGKDGGRNLNIFFERRIGTALYPSTSMMNHSCEPSIVTSFTGNHIIVRAAKKIKKGDEIFNCYGPHARRMVRCERQKLLKSQYFFTCNCHACTQEFDIMDVFQAWKCCLCKGPSVFQSTNEKCDNQNRVCLNCGQVLTFTREQMTKENMIYSLMAGNSLKDYLTAWRYGREIFYKFHETLGKAADQIGRLLYESDEFEKSIRFQKCSLLLVEKRYGSNSIELAREFEKIAMTFVDYSNVVTDKKIKKSLNYEAFKYLRKAYNTFKLFGEEGEIFNEMKLTLSNLYL